MNLELDPQQYDKCQQILAETIATTVKLKLIEAGLKDAQLEDLTAGITFSIASIIDNMAAVESDGVEVKPYLTFLKGDDSLLHYGENSSTNEFVYDALKKLFG